MGPGCQRVTCTHEKDVDVATAMGRRRVATVRGIRSGKADYGCVAFTEKGVYPLALGTKYIYRDLCKQIVDMFTSKKAPLDPAVTVEIVAFIEAASQAQTTTGRGKWFKRRFCLPRGAARLRWVQLAEPAALRGGVSHEGRS